MLEYLKVSNYKAFGAEPSLMKLRPLTVVIGKNNSGKSSLLKLVSILSTMSECKSTAPILLKNDSVSLGGRYQDLFHNNVTSSLRIGLGFDDMAFEATYLMNQGEIFVGISDDKLLGWESPAVFSQENPFFVLNEHMIHSGDSHLSGKFSSFYIGPLRPGIRRNIQPGGENDSRLLPDGRNVCEVLLASYNSADKKLFNSVASWLADNLDCTGLNFERNSETSGSFSLATRHGSANVNLADVGQGIGQVLPVVVSSFMESHAEITIIEQPVLHLHPAAHSAVAARLADSALEMKRNYLIETHSHNFILALREMVADKKNPLKAEDVVIYSVEQDDDESWLKEITLDEEGNLSDWPEGVFAESYQLLKNIRSHQSR